MQIIINFNSMSIDLECHYISYFYISSFVIIHDNYRTSHVRYMTLNDVLPTANTDNIIIAWLSHNQTSFKSNQWNYRDETWNLLYIFKYIFNIFISWFSIIALIMSKSSIICLSFCMFAIKKSFYHFKSIEK